MTIVQNKEAPLHFTHIQQNEQIQTKNHLKV